MEEHLVSHKCCTAEQCKQSAIGCAMVRHSRHSGQADSWRESGDVSGATNHELWLETLPVQRGAAQANFREVLFWLTTLLPALGNMTLFAVVLPVS